MYYGGKGKKLDFKFGEGSMYYWGKGKEPNIQIWGMMYYWEKGTKFPSFERMCYWGKGKKPDFRFGQSLALAKIA